MTQLSTYTSFHNLNYNTPRSLWILKKCTPLSPTKQTYSANVFRVRKYSSQTPQAQQKWTIDHVKEESCRDLHLEPDWRTAPPLHRCLDDDRYVTKLVHMNDRWMSGRLESNPFHPSENSTNPEWKLVVFGNSRLPPGSLRIRPHIYTTFLSTARHSVIKDDGDQECDHHV